MSLIDRDYMSTRCTKRKTPLKRLAAGVRGLFARIRYAAAIFKLWLRRRS